MRLTWMGHSCFLVEGQPGDDEEARAEQAPVRVLMDPYASPGCGMYGPVDQAADVVTVSHSYDATWHGDLTHVEGPGGAEGADPVVLEDLYGKNAEAAGVRFESLRTFHTAAKDRPNTTLWFELDGLRVCHLGDLGHPLSEEGADRIRPVDVVLAPASGVYVVEPEDLVPVLADLDPSVVVPMHFQNDRIDLGMRPVDDLLELCEEQGWAVDRPGASSVELTQKVLPPGPRVVVLEPLR